MACKKLLILLIDSLKRTLIYDISKVFCFFYITMVLCTGTLFTSCSSNLNKEEYIDWVREYNNGLHTRTEFSEFVFDIQYQPAEYVLLMRNRNLDGEKDKNQESLQEISSLQYYTLTISTKNPNLDFINFKVQNASEKQRMLYYFSYQFQHDIHLMEDGQVWPCVLYHFERTPDLKNARTFVLGFENAGNTSGEVQLVIESDHFSSLPIKIRVSKNNIPTVKL
jgi:hypothetical protein